MTSSLACAIDPSESNTIVVNISPTVTPTISITASTTSICSGTTINFTATGTNGGTTPIYVWKKNGVTVGTNSSTYSSNTLANNDVITCVFTSNAVCVSANNITSNSITLTVNPSSTPGVSISTANTTICAGNNITFTATPVNGGTSPAYQWYKNNNPIAGATALTYTTSTASNNDIFKCILTSNVVCATTPTAASNNITITVNPQPIAASATANGPVTFCTGGSVVLSGNTNGGTWNTGATTATITATTTGSYFITNSNSCGSVNSNSITVTVNATPTASTISANGATTLCAGNTVTLSGNVGGTWSNGATTPSINVNTSGNYFVTNSNNCGSVNSNTIAVIVNPLPTASVISANGSTTICTGNTVTLSGNNNGGTWSNGATTASITVNTAGNYFVTNTNGCGSVNSNSINVVVNATPTASTISANGATTLCAGNTVTLSGNVGGTWSNGATTPSINVNTSGNYFVTNSNNCGSVNSNTIAVIVNPLPTASVISANGSTTICTGNTVTLLGNNNGGTWSNGATTASITVNTAGNYFVTNTNSCGSVNSNSINVNVSSGPVASTITAAGAITFCDGNNVTLNGNNGGTWSNGASSPSIVVNTSGDYYVINTNACGSVTSNSIIITVNPQPIAATIAANGPSSICNGNSVELTGNTNGIWSTGTTTPGITVTNAGAYFVTNTNSCGSINSNTITVTIDSLPSPATISAIGSTTICSGETVILTGNINGTWSNNETSTAIGVSTSGTYYVTNTNSCGNSVSNQITVVVLPAAPTPTITQVGYNLETNIGYNSYQWFNNNFPVPNETNPVFTPTSSGNYYVLVIDSNGCLVQSAVYNFVYVGETEIPVATELILIPNPAQTFVLLSTRNSKDFYGNLKVWSMNGDLMLEKNLVKNNQFKIDIEQWANGMYMIELIGDIKSERFKFIKQQ
jgi:hypothetical protein